MGRWYQANDQTAAQAAMRLLAEALTAAMGRWLPEATANALLHGASATATTLPAGAALAILTGYAAAAAIGAAVDWVTNFALLEAFPAWQNAWGLAWVMVSFAVLPVVAIGFVSKFLPETKGRSVEQVVQIFEKQAEASKAPI